MEQDRIFYWAITRRKPQITTVVMYDPKAITYQYSILQNGDTFTAKEISEMFIIGNELTPPMMAKLTRDGNEHIILSDDGGKSWTIFA